MNNTPTPETDAESFSTAYYQGEMVCAEFTRRLERELNELRRWTSVNGIIELQRERDDARAALATTRDVLCDALPNANAPTAELARMLWSERDEARETLKSESRIACERTRLLHEEMQNKSDLSEQLAAERALADRLAEALEWYRLNVQDCNKTTHEGDESRGALAKDYGRRANKALDAWKEARK